MNEKRKTVFAHPTLKPARTWEQVVAEFNRRNPDNPIPSTGAARSIEYAAIKKIRKHILKEGLLDEFNSLFD